MPILPQGAMKRFLLFAGDKYYPVGGADDLIGSFNDRDEAEDAGWPGWFEDSPPDWAHVFDCETGEIVSEFRAGKWRGPGSRE